MDRREFIERLSLGLLATGAATLAPLRTAFAGRGHHGRKPTIIVDPGHGGVDPGAIGHKGLEEKHVVLDIAERCASDLATLTGASVHLTRRSDSFLTLEKRVAIAEAHKADMFISVHADSAPDPRARGLSIYTLSEHASDGLAAAIASRENAADSVYGAKLKKYGDTVASILYDMARRETLILSRRMQHRLLHDLGENVRLLENPGRHANFAVLRSPDVPAVLIETGFLSNAHDEVTLRSGRYRRRLGSRMAHALRDALSHVIET